MTSTPSNPVPRLAKRKRKCKDCAAITKADKARLAELLKQYRKLEASTAAYARLCRCGGKGSGK